MKLILLFPFIHFGQIESIEYHPNQVRKEVRKIVEKIAIGGIDTEAIGYGGERTDQYSRFIRLKEKVNIEELVALMNHPAPSVRGYSFWGLAKLHYDNLETIFIKHANDNAIIFFMDGCSPMDIPVIEFMEQVVQSNVLDVDCKKLSKSVINKMRLERKTLPKKESTY